jgi:NurA-like 5'-3' nuclease
MCTTIDTLEYIMTIHIDIPDQLAEKVTRAAQAQGIIPEDLVLEAVREYMSPLSRLNSALAPIRQAFAASGLSEDDAVDLFEAEKHALRAERQATKL